MINTIENPLLFASIGGLILALATSLNYCLRGKITGMSGIVTGIATYDKETLPQKLSIAGGMLLISGISFIIFKNQSIGGVFPFGKQDQLTKSTSSLGFAIAGLLVGVGCKLSNGCTSGHGLCGLPRLSYRSIASVVIFLSTAIGISTLRLQSSIGFLSDQSFSIQVNIDHDISVYASIGGGILCGFLGLIIRLKIQNIQNSCNKQNVLDQIITFFVGLLFGLGLLVAGMVRRSNIIGFLSIGADWNPSLLFVLGCGVIINLFTFNYMIRKHKQPLFSKGQLFNPQHQIDKKLVFGSLLFGLGWGISGLCPGPAIMHFSIFTVPIGGFWFGGMIIGIHITKLVQQCYNKGSITPVITINESFDSSSKVSSIVSNSNILKVDKTSLQDSTDTSIFSSKKSIQPLPKKEKDNSVKVRIINEQPSSIDQVIQL